MQDVNPDTRDQAAIGVEIAAGLDLLRRGQSLEANRVADRLLAGNADHADVNAFAGEARMAADDPEAALVLIDRAIDLGGQHVKLLPRRAHVLMGLMRRADALSVAAQLADMAGSDARALWSAGSICSRCDDPQTAAVYFLRAVDAGCTDPELLYDLATAQFFLGDFQAAERNLDALLAQVPKAGDALYLRATLRKQEAGSNHVEQLESLLKAGFDNPIDAAGALYALAKELEDIEQPARSFAALTQGARFKRSSLDYNAAAERAAIDSIRHAYTADVIHADRLDGGGHAQPIFIVGMPRTGTTLVERILGRHADVASVGELPYFGGALATAASRKMQAMDLPTMVEASLMIDFDALGQEYLKGAAQADRSGVRVTVNKLPINFIYCGLIRKALPDARIVHLVRDPMDACYAIYKTLFHQAYHFSYDLDELAAYYATYFHLMRHWHAVMPGEILDVSYEALVTDPSGQGRRLLDWCGLDWNARVLDPTDDARPSTTASAAQVRGPMHAESIGRWRAHEAGLAALRTSLANAGVLAN